MNNYFKKAPMTYAQTGTNIYVHIIPGKNRHPGNLLPMFWHKIFSLAGKIIFGHQSLLESEDFFDDGHDLLARVRHVALVENASVGPTFTPFQF